MKGERQLSMNVQSATGLSDRRSNLVPKHVITEHLNLLAKWGFPLVSVVIYEHVEFLVVP